MLRWILKPESLIRGLLIWLALVGVIFWYVVMHPSVVDRDAAAGGIACAWVGVFVAYLFYRRPNPVAALGDIRRDLTRPTSTGRGWLVGIVVGFPLVAWALFAFPEATDQHQWLVWFPVGVGAIFGYTAHSERSLVRVAVIGVRRTLTATLAIAIIAIVAGIVVGGVVGVGAFLGSYGILGVIAVLLAVIALQLSRIATRL